MRLLRHPARRRRVMVISRFRRHRPQPRCPGFEHVSTTTSGHPDFQQTGLNPVGHFIEDIDIVKGPILAANEVIAEETGVHSVDCFDYIVNGSRVRSGMSQGVSCGHQRRKVFPRTRAVVDGDPARACDVFHLDLDRKPLRRARGSVPSIAVNGGPERLRESLHGKCGHDQRSRHDVRVALGGLPSDLSQYARRVGCLWPRLEVELASDTESRHLSSFGSAFSDRHDCPTRRDDCPDGEGPARC